MNRPLFILKSKGIPALIITTIFWRNCQVHIQRRESCIVLCLKHELSY